MSHKKAQKAQNRFLPQSNFFVTFVLFCGWLFFFVAGVKADDGYRLWLRYDALPAHLANTYRERVKSIVVQGESATFDVIRRELSEGCTGLLGTPVSVTDTGDASVVVKLGSDAELKKLGPEGFRIRTIKSCQSRRNRNRIVNRYRSAVRCISLSASASNWTTDRSIAIGSKAGVEVAATQPLGQSRS